MKLKHRIFKVLPLLVFAVVSLTGCVQSHNFVSFQEEYIPVQQTVGQNEVQKLLVEEPTFFQPCVIVLLHGLMSPEDLVCYERRLAKEFCESCHVIRLQRQGLTTLTLSIAEQAQNTLKDLEEQIQMLHLDVKETPVLIVGHSQGGLVGAKAVLLNQANPMFRIVGLVTEHTPWHGVNLLNYVAYLRKYLPDFMLSKLQRMWGEVDLKNLKGLQDMAENSELIKELNNNPILVPIFAKGGYVCDGTSALENIKYYTGDSNANPKQKATWLDYCLEKTLIGFQKNDYVLATNSLFPKYSHQGIQFVGIGDHHFLNNPEKVRQENNQKQVYAFIRGCFSKSL